MAKPVKIRQAQPEPEALSIEQQNAIDLLVTGKTDREVAEAVGVSRQTVCQWRLHNPVFQAELNKRRKEVWGATVDKMRALLPEALDTLAAELRNPDNKDRWKVALELLKMSGLDLRENTLGMYMVGPDDPAKVQAEREREQFYDELLAGFGRATREG